MSANMNMISVTMQEFLTMVKESIIDEDYETPILCLGKSGIGKTEAIKGLCDEMGIGCMELRLVTLNEVDLLGVPTIEEQANGKKTTVWASMNDLPIAERDGERGILVLDEITSCTRTIRAAAFQLLDAKRALGNYKLPEKWLVVALGNGPEDGGVFEGLEYAFIGRCLGVRVEPDLNSWKMWAVDAGVHPAVLGFVSWQPQYLHQINVDAEYEEKLPSPRTWTKLSIKLNNAEKRRGGILDDRTVEIYAAAAVGEAAASMFASFYAYKKKTVSVDEIMEGKALDAIYDMDTQVMYMQIQTVVAGISAELKNTISGGDWPETTYRRIANACRWIIAVGKIRLDIATSIFNELNLTTKYFGAIVMDEKFDEICPELLEFATTNKLVYAKARN